MLRVLKSTYVFLGLALFITFVIAWGYFGMRKKEEGTSSRTHLLTSFEKETCKHQACGVTHEDEFFELLVVTSEELKKAFSLEFLFTAKLQQLNTKFFLVVEYRDENDKEFNRESKEVIVVEGENYIFNEFVIDRKALAKTSKLVVYLWNPEKSNFLIEGLKVSVKEDKADRYLPHLDIVKSNQDLFPENQQREFVDILILDEPKKYKGVNTCKIEVFNFIKSEDQVKPFLVLEYSTKDGERISYESKIIMSDIPRNSIIINDFQEFCKENSVLKIYLFSGGKYIPNSIREVKVLFYK